MLLVWKGSETSHHLGGKYQNYLQRAEFYHTFSLFKELLQPQWTSIILYNDVPRHLAPVVVKYYFIQDLHTSLKLEVAELSMHHGLDINSLAGPFMLS